MPDCLNLMDHYGAKYKIGWDECYDPKGRPKEKLDPWYMMVLCQRGVIYPWGGDLLAAEVVGRRPTVKRLAALGLKQIQDGDESAFVFDVGQFDDVAAIVKPRRRRKVSDAQRESAWVATI